MGGLLAKRHPVRGQDVEYDYFTPWGRSCQQAPFPSSGFTGQPWPPE
ncbi:hypothetical protein HMPREF1545_01621 [Oscillibacter sp. KLE 1728]|nr:hypothetical protein HMPREF1545_01621 [Oscillibacter sp. KLE 1728]